MRQLTIGTGWIVVTLALVACGSPKTVMSSSEATNTSVGELSKAGPQLSKITRVEEVEQYRCGNNNRKVQICHIPPGNPAARHTICIGASAVAAHVGHHKSHDGLISDYMGPCVADAPPIGGGSGGGTVPGTGTDPDAGLGGGTVPVPGTGTGTDADPDAGSGGGTVPVPGTGTGSGTDASIDPDGLGWWSNL